MDTEIELVEAQQGSENFNQYMEAIALPALMHCAWFVLNEEKRKNTEAVLYCIKVDSDWRWMVDMISPGTEEQFQEQRNRGFDPIAVGSVSWNFCRTVAEHFDEKREDVMAPPEDGTMKVILLSDEGCEVFNLEPKASLSRLA